MWYGSNGNCDAMNAGSPYFLGRGSQILFLLCLAVMSGSLVASDRTIGVYVALADNQNQGIVPVPKAIGNGDDPAANLYWGTAEGLKGWFDKSKTWQFTGRTNSAGTQVLDIRTYRHASTNAVLTAMAYRGAAIKQCIRDFETAVQSGSYDLVVYIGHNGLMDFDLPVPTVPAGRTNRTDCIVLCCKSDSYFRTRLLSAGGRPVLLTTQLMYPGAFILHAVADDWIKGTDLAGIRESAGMAYARNQKLSRKAGVGVFADLRERDR